MNYVYYISCWWFQTFFIFLIYGKILPIDFHIFQDVSNHQPDIYIYINIDSIMI